MNVDRLTLYFAAEDMRTAIQSVLPSDVLSVVADLDLACISSTEGRWRVDFSAKEES